ncbi:hypothetical protein [Actinomyces gaoshouyii]|uniref:hypothetical protein n=1 Tax=Actinomyces gaoshouyii TaxID=1960083 RepID=UPI000F77A1EA|nr:hypothetical protein [Actinomyces gaoshouyii]
MNRRLLSAIVAAAGLIVIALAVCFATVWRPSSTIEATLPASPEQNYVVTAPGVLNLVDSSVTIKATAADGASPVVIAVGHEADAKAWLAQDPYLSVTGLTDEKTLQASPVTEACDSSGACSAATPSNADPTSSDLWSNKADGTGSVSAVVNVSSSDMVALVATDGSGPAPSVSLSWERTVSTWWFMPSLILGGLLILIGVFGLLLDFQNRRAEAERRNRAAERQARLDAADGVSTAAVPSIEDPDRPLTRREKRDKERAERQGEEWVDPRTGRVYVGGVEVPSIPSSSEALTAQGAGAASADTSIGATSYDPYAGMSASTPPSSGAAGALDGAGRGDSRPDQGDGMTAYDRPWEGVPERSWESSSEGSWDSPADRPWESTTASLRPLDPAPTATGDDQAPALRPYDGAREGDRGSGAGLAEPVDYFGTASREGDGAQALRPAPSMIPGSAPYFQVDDPRGSSASEALPASPPVDLPAYRAGSSGPSTEDLGELGLGRSTDGQGAGGARDDKETI